MSIRAQIRHHMGGARLFPIEPVVPDDPVERGMVVSPEIQQLLVGPWESKSMERRCNRLRADLEVFVKGDIISISLTPFEHKDAYMGRLDRPRDEVWDIRSRDPRPALRVFGRFAERDFFVALNWSPRSAEWSKRKPLGHRKTSWNWDFAILECQERWKQLFPHHEPIHGGNIHDYVSANALLV